MIGLCSKTYIVRKARIYRPSAARIAAFGLLRRSKKLKRKRCPYRTRELNEFKFSSKGISKRHVKAPMAQFRRVLRTTRAQSGHNRGFRVRDNAVFTYTQERRGFSYFYCKRRVLDDGVNTVPRDITLCPRTEPLAEVGPQQESASECFPTESSDLQQQVVSNDIDDRVLIDMLASNFED